MITKFEKRHTERIIIENKKNIVADKKLNDSEYRCEFENKSLKKEIEYLKEII